MKKAILALIFTAAVSGAAFVIGLESLASAQSSRHLQSSVPDVASPISTVAANAPFRVRYLQSLPPGYRLATSVLRDSPTGARNAISVVLNYTGPDGGFLELTEIQLNMTLDQSTVVTIAGRRVQFAEYSLPDGATTRSYMWRDDDVSVQLNVYIPQSAQSTLSPAALNAIIAATQ